jgi:hypothetical protein
MTLGLHSTAKRHVALNSVSEVSFSGLFVTDLL